MLYALSSFYEYPNIDVELESFSFYDVPHTYYSIFFNNLKVGLLIALGGYFSFGLISAFILFYNGFLLYEIISIASLVGLSLNEILYGTIYHGLIEFIAFLLFGSIGFKGILFGCRVCKNQKVRFMELSYKSFIQPTVFLAISAIIESNL